MQSNSASTFATRVTFACPAIQIAPASTTSATAPLRMESITSGLGFATFVLGDVTQFNRYTSSFAGETNAKEFQPRDFFYGQDTWRATPKLTLNLGMRYEYYAAERVNGKDNGALLNLQTGYINVAGEGGLPLNMGVAAAKNTWNPASRCRLPVQRQDSHPRGLRPQLRPRRLRFRPSDTSLPRTCPCWPISRCTEPNGNTSYAFNLSDPTNQNVPGAGKPANATSQLAAFGVPAISSAGQIPITANLPGTTSSIGSSVNVKARPFTERLPTLDAWNFTVQRSITATLSAEVAYVGNKGTHTLSDGDGNNTNPNEPAITLPANFTKNNVALHYDPSGGSCLAGTAGCTATTQIASNGATSNTTLLRRYTNGTLPACGGGPCGWTQDISYYGDDQDTHYNALQVKLTKTMTHGYSFGANYAYQRRLRQRERFCYLG